MIYVCIPSRDEADTIGLLLWRIRKAFESLGREYHVVVGDDGSTDHTAEVLDLYAKVSPLTVLSTRQAKGYAATVERLLRKAIELSDRPKRDGAIVMHGDFAHGPDLLADFVRKLDSGADIVVGEGAIDRHWSRGYRWTRRWSAYLLRRSAAVPGVKDPTSGFLGFRLASIRPLFEGGESILQSDGWAANAELVGRAAVHARRVETVSFAERLEFKNRPSRVVPWPMARSLWRASGVARRAVQRERAAGPQPGAEAGPKNRRRKGS
ncbi:MAG: glycosyltransferase family 2 protein [Gemmatimonadetes bacterium]|nr:glycosyltransferase family 2 protein [Gemmatimonadota bacterium]